MKTINELISKTNIQEGLVRAVIHQNGGWDSFKQAAQDIANYGADKGWVGFTYHTDTVKFFNNQRDLIRQYVTTTAEERGIGSLKNLRYLNGNYSTDEIAQTLYGPKSKVDTQIANALAWFVLKEVARAYSDALKA